MVGISLDLNTDLVYIESVQNWTKGVSFTGSIMKNQNGRPVPLYLAGRTGESPNQFESILIVPNGAVSQYFYAPGQGTTDDVFILTTYDDVISASFLYPFWVTAQ